MDFFFLCFVLPDEMYGLDISVACERRYNPMKKWWKSLNEKCYWEVRLLVVDKVGLSDSLVLSRRT